MSDDFSDQFATDELVIGGAGAPRRSRRRWIGGGAIGLLAIGGGAAAWAATSFFSQGTQPAEALPDSTIGYVSVDLDPSGAQKIAALKLARKFPAFKDKVGLQTGDDIRKWIFGKAADGNCDLDFDKQVAPWLGSRAAVAAVGTDHPIPVVVVQTTDAGKAEAGVKALLSCGGTSADSAGVGWTINGDWIVFAETTEKAKEVVKETEKGSLADDPDFQSWTDKAGDSGILTAYAAPAAGQVLAQELGKATDGGSTFGSASPIDPFGMLGSCPGLSDPSAATQRMKGQLADFRGAAATLRFGADGVELEMVGDTQAFGGSAATSTPSGTPVVSTLPADTAVGIGVSFPQDWTAQLTKNLQNVCGEGTDPKALFAPLSRATGLDLPDDLPKLLGDSAALALGPGIDVEGMVNSGDPSTLPVALKLRGEKDTIDGVAAKLRQTLGAPAGALEPVAGDGAVAIGLDKAYAEEVAKSGGLGSSDEFRSVVPHGDKSASVVYVSVNALDKAVKALSGGDDEIAANLAPLRAIGLSGWSEDGDGHAVFKVSLD
ncbi:hypothetical protein GCM10009798_21240 [Nocardioides panacihumi]|uniref:DUF3352 domain-containing protein n=1 Tax=Nocardioides panacihumi TaxID=400774 RepID=A0ABN2R074_9ACTN